MPQNAADAPSVNAYFSVASFKPSATNRKYENFAGLKVLVLDDPENVPFPPTWLLRTSPGKCQAGYRLSEPMVDIETAKRLHQQLAQAGHLPVDRNGNNPVRYVRLPVGANTKHDPPFPCVLELFEPDRTYDLPELIGALGLDAGIILRGKQPNATPARDSDGVIYEGARNSTLASLAGTMRRRGMSQEAIEAALLAENSKRCLPSLDEAEVRRIAQSIAGYPPAPDASPATDPLDFHFDLRPLSLEILRKPIAPKTFAIEPHLPRGVLTELVGAHGISKSTLALDMVLCVATGRQWCGLSTDTGKAVFASREDSYDEILRRVQAWVSTFPPNEREAAEQSICKNLVLLGREETAQLALTSKEFGKCTVRQEAIDLVVERCQNAILVVLETASRLHRGDELNEDLAQLAEAFEQVANQLDAAVVLVRHTSKEAARAKSVDSYVGRGGGALSDAARSVLVLIQLDPKEARDRGIALDGLAMAVGSPVIALHHAKASYSAPHKPLYFMRLPGPRLQVVVAPDSDNVFGERLLAFLKKEAAKDTPPMSTRKLKECCGEHHVPQAKVEEVLGSLQKAGRIKTEEITGQRGGTHRVWVLIPDLVS